MKQLWTYLAHLEVTCLTSLFYFLVHMNYFISHSFMSIPIFWLLFFLHQTNNTNICVSDSQYNVSDHVSAHQPQNKNSLDKVYHEKYGVNYRSYFRNNLPLKKDRILISELFSQIINLQWIMPPNMNDIAIEKEKDLALT